MEIDGKPRPLPPLPKLVKPILYDLEDEYETMHVEHEYADLQDSEDSEPSKPVVNDPIRSPMPPPRAMDLYEQIVLNGTEKAEDKTQNEPKLELDKKNVKFTMLSTEKRSISNLFEEMDFKMNQKLDKFKLDLEAALAARAKITNKTSKVDCVPIMKAPTCILKKQNIQNMQNDQKVNALDGQNGKSAETDQSNSEISNKRSFCLFYPFQRLFGGPKKPKNPALDYKSRRKLSAKQRSDLMAKFEDRTGMVENNNKYESTFKKCSLKSQEPPSAKEVIVADAKVIPFSKTKFRRSFRKFCRQISKEFEDDGPNCENKDELLEDEAVIYENLDRAMKSYIGEMFAFKMSSKILIVLFATGLISRMSSTQRNSHSNRISHSEDTPRNPSKLTTLSREILKEFDPNADNHMKKLFPNKNSHMVWMEKLRVFFETTAEINNFEDATDDDSEDGSDDSELTLRPK